MSHLGAWQIVPLLNEILSTLGSTKPSLWPFLEKTGQLVTGISAGDLIPSETAGAAEDLEHDFAPFEHPGKVHSYHFHPTGDHHLAGIDNAAYTFGNGVADVPFSVGAWICPNDITSVTILSKYNAAGTAREWRLTIDGNSKLSLELYDESADDTEIAAGDTALAIGQWVFVVATYDGGESDPVVKLYLNAVLDNDGSTVETANTAPNFYVAMEDMATPLLVGADGTTAAPANEFHGRIALPFVTGKALTAAEIATLYDLTSLLMGA